MKKKILGFLLSVALCLNMAGAVAALPAMAQGTEDLIIANDETGVPSRELYTALGETIYGSDNFDPSVDTIRKADVEKAYMVTVATEDPDFTLQGIQLFPNIGVLDLTLKDTTGTGWAKNVDLSLLAQLPALYKLAILGPRTDYSFLKVLPNVYDLKLASDLVDDTTDLSAISTMPSLEYLTTDFYSRTDYTFISSIDGLRGISWGSAKRASETGAAISAADFPDLTAADDLLYVGIMGKNGQDCVRYSSEDRQVIWDKLPPYQQENIVLDKILQGQGDQTIPHDSSGILNWELYSKINGSSSATWSSLHQRVNGTTGINLQLRSSLAANPEDFKVIGHYIALLSMDAQEGEGPLLDILAQNCGIRGLYLYNEQKVTCNLSAICAALGSCKYLEHLMITDYREIAAADTPVELDLAQLNRLQELTIDIGNDTTKGLILYNWGQAPDLRSVTACGVLDDTDYTGIDALSRLQTLKLEGGNFSTLGSLSGCRDLQYLKLSYAAAGSERVRYDHLDSLQNCPDLKRIELSDMLLDDPAGLGTVPNLESLQIHNSYLKETSWLQNMEHLKSLELVRCEPLQTVDEVEALTQLERLYIQCLYLQKKPNTDKLTHLSEVYISEPTGDTPTDNVHLTCTQGYIPYWLIYNLQRGDVNGATIMLSEQTAVPPELFSAAQGKDLYFKLPNAEGKTAYEWHFWNVKSVPAAEIDLGVSGQSAYEQDIAALLGQDNTYTYVTLADDLVLPDAEDIALKVYAYEPLPAKLALYDYTPADGQAAFKQRITTSTIGSTSAAGESVIEAYTAEIFMRGTPIKNGVLSSKKVVEQPVMHNIEYTYWVGDSGEYVFQPSDDMVFTQGKREDMLQNGIYNKAGTYKITQTDDFDGTVTTYTVHVIEKPADTSTKMAFSTDEWKVKIGQNVGADMLLDKPPVGIPNLVVENRSLNKLTPESTDDLSEAGKYFCLHDRGYGPPLSRKMWWAAVPSTHIAVHPGSFEVTTREQLPGDPKMRVTVEEPVITANLNETVKTGSLVELRTELTNTALTDQKVSTVKEIMARSDREQIVNADGNRVSFASTDLARTPGFEPSVEVIEGADLIRCAEGDYTNTLHTSEKILFERPGKVTFKIRYKMLMTLTNSRGAMDTLRTYDAEKIISVVVSDDAPATSEPGDTSGDGKINMKDLTLLHRSVAGYNVLMDPAGADVNCDGKVNMKDVTILHRHLAGYDVELGKPVA